MLKHMTQHVCGPLRHVNMLLKQTSLLPRKEHSDQAQTMHNVSD